MPDFNLESIALIARDHTNATAAAAAAALTLLFNHVQFSVSLPPRGAKLPMAGGDPRPCLVMKKINKTRRDADRRRPNTIILRYFRKSNTRRSVDNDKK